jgi:hypothetical protein
VLYSKSVVSLPPSLDNPVSKHTQFPETKREREREYLRVVSGVATIRVNV